MALKTTKVQSPFFIVTSIPKSTHLPEAKSKILTDPAIKPNMASQSVYQVKSFQAAADEPS
jgi:hypothetical protein